MKTVLRILLVIVVGFIVFGYALNYLNDGEGEKFIGIGILMLTFILMPLFIYHRYKNKDLSQYTFKKHHEKKNEND